MPRIRVEGLLAAFPKLMGSDNKQHTFVETDTVRYVYQSMETLYLLLVTNRASNIVEDLETLRLLSKVVPNITGTSGNLSEEHIVDKCFDLIFAFDEVIASGGYREPITLQQIRNNMEMESHEEKLHNMIKLSKMESAKDQAAAAAKSIKDKQKEQQRLGTATSYSGNNMSTEFPSGPNTLNAAPTSLPVLAQVATTAIPSSTSNRTGAVKGMSLGGAVKSKSFEDALIKEDKLAPVTSTQRNVSADTAVAAVSCQQVQHPLMIAITEKVSAKLSRDGVVELFEIKGSLMLTAANDDAANCTIKLRPLKSTTASSFSFNTHPKVNKALYEKSSVIQLKEAGKGFPSGRSVGILKWTNSSSNHDEFIPLKINCWPEEESRGQMNVSIEYSMDLKDIELYDVNIRIPLGTTAQPNVLSIDGSSKHNAATNELIWSIDLIDRNNSSGSLEFTILQRLTDAFFPIQVSFASKQLYCPIEITEISSAATEASIPYGLSKGMSSEDYFIE